VHCAAGICRSGAVGYFANKYLGLNEQEFLTKNYQIFPNQYVYDILCGISGLKKQKENELNEVFKSDNYKLIF
jgi:predicted protein tyrosine phosphatase